MWMSFVSNLTFSYFMHSSLQMNSQFGDSYFLVSDPDSAGSPPRRVPPSIVVNHANNHKLHPSDTLVGQKIALSGDEYKVKYAAAKQVPKPVKNINIPSLGLPALHTGTYWFIIT